MPIRAESCRIGNIVGLNRSIYAVRARFWVVWGNVLAGLK